MKLIVGRLHRRFVNMNHMTFRFNPEQVQVKKRMQVRTKQDSIAWMIVSLSSIRMDVSGLQNSNN